MAPVQMNDLSAPYQVVASHKDLYVMTSMIVGRTMWVMKRMSTVVSEVC